MEHPFARFFLELSVLLPFSPVSRRLGATLFAASALLAAPLAHAGVVSGESRARIEAIARGNETAVNAAYAPDAVLEWIGGPLDGRYAMPQSIAEVWAKFAHANSQLTAKVSDLHEAVNPKGAPVTADGMFHG